MKKFTLFILLSLLCGFFQNTNAQQYIKIDASFYSPVLDEVKMIDIYLPGDYYVNPEQEYACIYYLHSGGDNQNSGNTDALYYYNFHNEDTTISSPPAIFVCPDGSCGPYAGSMWANSELYGPFEDYFMQDVIGFVESNFRAIPEKNFRSLVGWSMGGCGAVDPCASRPAYFRACIPGLAAMAMSDTTLNSWRSTCYEENGSYNLTYAGSGFNTQVLFTCAGAWSPNLDIEPYSDALQRATLGNWVDTVLTKWYQYDMSRRVKDLPDETELSWFLVCGINDILCNYPTYMAFSDSLEAYNIGYDYNYFDGGHEFDPESWIMAIHWIDSIINLEYQTVGVEIINEPINYISVYPNPASDKLTINYQLKKSAVVNINLIDLQGKQHMSLNKEAKAIGIETESLNISQLPPGVYFLRLQAGNDVVTKKLIKVN